MSVREGAYIVACRLTGLSRLKHCLSIGIDVRALLRSQIPLGTVLGQSRPMSKCNEDNSELADHRKYTKIHTLLKATRLWF